MKNRGRIVFASICAVIFFSGQAGAQDRSSDALAKDIAASMASEVWLADRTDNRPGKGTSNDPYDVSTESRFDALMGKAGLLQKRAYTIHLGAGTFLTTGILLNVNSRLIGEGMDVTVIKLAPNSAPIGRKALVIGANGASPAGLSNEAVEDLTVDGNIAGQSQAPNDVCISGVASPVIERVKAINLGTTLAGTGMESFWLYGNSVSTTDPIYNEMIEDCICVAPAFPSYVTFIDLSGANINREGPASVAARNAIIRNCKVVCPTVNGTFDGHAFTFANCDGGIIEDCYTDGIDVPVYQDTWSSRRLTVRGNTFLRCRMGLSFQTTNPASYMDGVFIEDNLIEPRAEANTCGMRFYYTLCNFLNIERNKIRPPPFSPDVNNSSGIELSSFPSQLCAQVQDNCIDTLPVSRRVMTPGSIPLQNVAVDYENNRDSFGENIVGRRKGRATFLVPSPGWYVLWCRSTTGRGLLGRIEVRARRAVIGTVTLSGGKSFVACPSILKTSVVAFKIMTPSGTPGRVYVTLDTEPGNPDGLGFELHSTNSSDSSTYAYTVSSGEESNSYCFEAGGASSLTKVYAAAPSGSQAMLCTEVRSFAEKYKDTLDAYFSCPGIVTVDVESGLDEGYWEETIDAPGTPSIAPGSSPKSTLSF